MGITDHLSVADVVLDLVAPDKQAVLQNLAAAAAARLGQPEREVLRALLAREKLGSTALGRGVALPHAHLGGIEAPLMLLARLRAPVAFDARDENPVDLAILVLWPKDDPDGFLPLLSETCRVLREPSILRRLRLAATPEDVVALLATPALEA